MAFGIDIEPCTIVVIIVVCLIVLYRQTSTVLWHSIYCRINPTDRCAPALHCGGLVECSQVWYKAMKNGGGDGDSDNKIPWNWILCSAHQTVRDQSNIGDVMFVRFGSIAHPRARCNIAWCRSWTNRTMSGDGAHMPLRSTSRGESFAVLEKCPFQRVPFHLFTKPTTVRSQHGHCRLCVHSHPMHNQGGD